MTLRIPRRQYADLYGPTVSDRVRLADTDLLIRIERDLTTPGEEAKFGGGKVIRDGMGQSARATRADATLDTVITNAVIIDHWGIVKADVAIKEGYISAIGKAGNPDIQPGVTIVIGPGTEIIAANAEPAHTKSAGAPPGVRSSTAAGPPPPPDVVQLNAEPVKKTG